MLVRIDAVGQFGPLHQSRSSTSPGSWLAGSDMR
jgi:hypothetical protein